MSTNVLRQMFRPLSRLLRRPEPKPLLVEVPDENVQLEQILMLFANRPQCETAGSFRLMTREMSPDCLMFATMEHVKTGEDLEVRVLMKHGNSLSLRGKVNWAMQQGQGTSGQIDLGSMSLEERQSLKVFLNELRSLK